VHWKEFESHFNIKKYDFSCWINQEIVQHGEYIPSTIEITHKTICNTNKKLKILPISFNFIDFISINMPAIPMIIPIMPKITETMKKSI